MNFYRRALWLALALSGPPSIDGDRLAIAVRILNVAPALGQWGGSASLDLDVQATVGDPLKPWQAFLS
ncbi:MAG TPA: hypothetical protein VN277_09105 [Acidiferrobacterales bacterium]|nr:hypothetical protein [Acidiferrobacterales bacterium]